MFKKLMIAGAALALSAVAMAGNLAAPTAFQIDPYLATICMRDGPATQVYATGTDANGNLVGEATLQGFVCALRVHSGRGPGIRIFSACSDVVWTPDGSTVLSVTPIAATTGYSIVCD